MGNHEYCEHCGVNDFHHDRPCNPDIKKRYQNRCNRCKCGHTMVGSQICPSCGGYQRSYPEVCDKLGCLIRPGDWIAYGHLLSRSAGLRIGKVVSIQHAKPGYVSPYAKEPPKLDVHITVQGIEDCYGWRNDPPKLCSRKGTLLFPDRTIVLDSKMLPAKYRELLDI